MTHLVEANAIPIAKLPASLNGPTKPPIQRTNEGTKVPRYGAIPLRGPHRSVTHADHNW